MPLYGRAAARRSLFDTVVYKMFSQIATLLGYVVLVRAMSRQDFGVLNLLYGFIPVVGTVASFGLEQTLRRYQPEYLRDGNHVAAAWLVRFIGAARFGTSVIVLAIVLLTWNLVAPIFKLEPYRLQFLFFGLLIILHFQVGILQLSLASRMLHKFSVGSLAMIANVKLIAYLVLLAFDSMTLEHAIAADMLGYAVAYFRLRFLYRKHVAPPAESSGTLPSREDKKRMLRYGMYNNFNDAGSFVLESRSDNFFIAAFIDPVSVAIYSFYTRVSYMSARLLPGRYFQNVVQPLFFSIEREKAVEKLPRYFSLLLNLNLVVQWPFLAYATAYHHELIRLVFGTKYIEHSQMLPMIMAFATLNLIAVPATLVAQYEEKASVILLSKIFAAYNVVALLVLLPVAGLYGAILATGSAQFFKNLFIWWFVRDRARWLNATGVVVSGLLIFGSAVVACYALKRLLGLPPLGDLIIGAVICAAAALLYLRSPGLSKSDRAILGSVLRGKEARYLRRLGILGVEHGKSP